MTGTTAAELASLDEALFTGSLATWSGSLSINEDEYSVSATDLGSETFFADLVTRFGRAHPDADYRAIASFWSQHYFARLTIAMTVFCLGTQRPLRLDLKALRVTFCEDSGLPLRFHLRCGGSARGGDVLVKALYEDQIAGTAAELRRHTGLAARLLWENAGFYGVWILGELARTRPDLAFAAMRLLSDGGWPRLGCALFSPFKGAALEGRPARRRVCCLRYRLPGVDRCSGVCPLSTSGAEVLPATV